MLFSYLRSIAGSILLLLTTYAAASPQDSDSLISGEQLLLEEFDKMMAANAFRRYQPAIHFYEDFVSMLALENSFEYPFDELKNVGKIYSPDKRLRAYTWNIPVDVEDNLYFGIIQYYSGIEKKYRLVELIQPVTYASGQGKIRKDWQPELYYQIIETKHAGQKYYTLLGFNFDTPMANQKSIDVLSIDDYDELYFCEKLFQYDGKLKDRRVFEYNEKAVMILRYDEHKKMIVFDHLAPTKPSLEGKYEFYGPDFTYEGLKFEKGVWVNYHNIDITN
jgi:hypothetical protein